MTWPGDPHLESREYIRGGQLSQVAGVVNPLTSEFINFLRHRYRELVS